MDNTLKIVLAIVVGAVVGLFIGGWYDAKQQSSANTAQ
jgi:uncharacterized protein YneF (UPF0154 family)